MEYKEIETEHGFFTENPTTGQTAEEVYQKWLANKDKPPVIEEDKTDILSKEVAQNQEYLLELDCLISNGIINLMNI